MYKIPLSATPVDAAGLGRVLKGYEGMPVSKIVEDFEAKLREYTGTSYVVALNSGTSAIHLALKALGVGPGDIVLAPTSTYVATVNPIVYLNAIPVFIDSEPETWNISPALLESAIVKLAAENRRPKCLVAMHSYGMPTAMDDVLAICQRHEIAVLEDAAEAIGSTYKGRLAGTLTSVGVISFNSNKILTTFGGGAVLTKNPEIHRKIVFWASHSRENKPYYEHTNIGYNYRMSPLNAAAGLLGMAELTSSIKRRRQVYSAYKKSLDNRLEAAWPDEPEGFFSNRWLTTLLLNPLKINNIMVMMEAEGIECRRLWNPMHRQPVFKDCRSFLNGFADQLFERGMCLPSSHLGHIEEVSKVILRA